MASEWAGLGLAATLQWEQDSHFWLHFQRGSLSCWEIQMGEKVIPIKEDYTVSMHFVCLFTNAASTWLDGVTRFDNSD